MKRFLTLYKVEQKTFFRSPDVFIFNICMPVVVLILIALIGGSKSAGESGMTYLQSSFAALSAVGICCSGFMSIPIVIVESRDKKILKHFYCSPCSPVRILAVDVICSGVMAFLSAILVWLAGALFFGYHMEGNKLVFLGSWFLTMLSMFSIGLLVASLCRTTKSMNVASSILYFPMLLFSGATIPIEIFPKILQNIGGFMPLGVGIRLMKSASMGVEMYNCYQEIAILLVIALLCSGIAVKFFRWE